MGDKLGPSGSVKAEKSPCRRGAVPLYSGYSFILEDSPPRPESSVGHTLAGEKKLLGKQAQVKELRPKRINFSMEVQLASGSQDQNHVFGL